MSKLAGPYNTFNKIKKQKADSTQKFNFKRYHAYNRAHKGSYKGFRCYCNLSYRLTTFGD